MATTDLVAGLLAIAEFARASTLRAGIADCHVGFELRGGIDELPEWVDLKIERRGHVAVIRLATDRVLRYPAGRNALGTARLIRKALAELASQARARRTGA
jgi:hypothetical protein